MVIRLYETSDGEVLTQWVNVKKPVYVTKKVEATKTKTVDAVQVVMKSVKTITLTRFVPDTKLIFVTHFKYIPITRILSKIISKTVGKPITHPAGNPGEGNVIKVQPRVIKAIV